MTIPDDEEEGASAAERVRPLWEEREGRAAAADAVYETLAEAIRRRYLPEGLRLGEEELAGWFGVSRTPVREALVRLEADHLAERVARRGLVVTRITADDILEVYVIREALDGLAAREAARHSSAAERAQLNWLNERLRASADQRQFRQMAQITLEFHEELAHAAHNALLLTMVRSVHSRVRRFPGTTLAVGDRAHESVAEHAAIIEAIKDGNAEAAERLARRHMANSTRVRVEMLDSNGPDVRSSRELESIP